MSDGFLKFLSDNRDALSVVTGFAILLVSILVSVIGVIGQAYVARRNAISSVIVSNRLRRLEDLENNIARLETLAVRATFLQKSMKFIQDTKQDKTVEQKAEYTRMLKEYEERTIERNQIGHLISFRLPVSEPDRKRLFSAINDLVEITPGVVTASDAETEAQFRFETVTREILDKERVRLEAMIKRERGSLRI